MFHASISMTRFTNISWCVTLLLCTDALQSHFTASK
jgi:hypothetical protein